MMSQPADAGREHAHDPRGADAIGNADEEMIRRAVAGDAFAVHSLLLAHRPRLLEYVLRQMPHKLRSIYDAEDVVQDVCVDACRRMSDFKPGGQDAVARWLMTIARHRIIDVLRARHAAKRGGGRAAADDHAGLVTLVETLAVYRRTPSRSAAAHELALTLIRSIDGLPKDYRDVIWMRHVEGLPVRAVALKMNRSEGAIHLLCHRALKQLRLVLRTASIFV